MIDQKLVRSIVNQMRAIEALSRVAKVMSRSLFKEINEGTELLNKAPPEGAKMNLKNSIDQFIDSAEELHTALNDIAVARHVKIDEEDDGIVMPQAGGGDK